MVGSLVASGLRLSWLLLEAGFSNFHNFKFSTTLSPKKLCPKTIEQTMALLLDLPAEIRQQIIRMIPGSVPDEIRLDQGGWPDAIHQLFLTCKLLRADTIKLMRIWSFDCLIWRSRDIERLPRLILAMEKLGLQNKVRKIRLLLWCKVRPASVRYCYAGSSKRWTVDQTAINWVARLPGIPRGDIETVVVDASPLESRMHKTRSHLVNARLGAVNTSNFVSKYRSDVADIIMHLTSHFHRRSFKDGFRELQDPPNPPVLSSLTRIVLGGQYGESCRSTVDCLVPDAGSPTLLAGRGASAFVGSFCNSQMPTHLSLHHLLQKCGIRLDLDRVTGYRTNVVLDISGIELLSASQENEIDPSKDFAALSPLLLSKYSASAYYVSALDHEENARLTVIRLLAFTLETRQSQDDARHFDFLPAPPARENLVIELCNDLGLSQSTIDGEFGKFIRVSSPMRDRPEHNLDQTMGALSISHSMQ